MDRRNRLHNFKRMAAYSTGDMPAQGIAQLISAYFLAYLTFVEGMNPAVAGMCIMIGRIWDAVTDPVMGVIVEKTRTRFGSVRPYFLIGIIPIFISYLMLWYSFGIETMAAKAVYYTFAYILFSTSFTIIMVPYESLLPRIVDDYSERTNYASVRMIFSGLAAVTATYMYEFVINSGGNTTLSPELKGRFGLMALILGLLFCLPLLVTFLGTKEKIKPINKDMQSIKGVFQQYGDLLRNKSYRRFYLMSLSSVFMSNMLITGMTFFAYIILSQDKVLGLTVITLVLTIKGATEIGFFPVNVVLMKKFNKHMPYKVDIPLIIFACVVALLIPANSSPIPFIISISLLGMGVSCLGFVPMTLMPDITDIDELISGKRREGISAGLWTLGRKTMSGISMLITGAILSAFGINTDSPGSSLQTPMTIWGVKTIYAIIPIICSILILVLVRTYRVNKSNHGMVKEKISEKRLKGYAELSLEEIKECEDLTGLPYDKLWISKRD